MNGLLAITPSKTTLLERSFSPRAESYSGGDRDNAYEVDLLERLTSKR